MNESAVELHYRELGDPEKPPLLFLHGLFGSSINWLGIARRLESAYRIIIPDLRNHGRSPHRAVMSYESMVEDLLELLERLHIDQVNIVGHSMGGKVAMWLALNHPEQVNKLVVVDVAPVAYAHRFDGIFSGLLSVNLESLSDRKTADLLLSETVEQESTRNYLLQNLLNGPDGWSWRFNLRVLQDAVKDLSGFPDAANRVFPGEVQFLYGEQSDYVKSQYYQQIRSLFPFARIRRLDGAGHWVYAEQPEAFIQALKRFL